MQDQVTEPARRLAVWWRIHAGQMERRLTGDHGEGVISAAIAVLIFALLGLAMWVGFELLFNDTTERTREAVEQTGR